MSICGKWAYDDTVQQHNGWGHPQKWFYVENKEPHYTTSYNQSYNGTYSLARCSHTPVVKRGSSNKGFRTSAMLLPPAMQLSVQLTAQNSSQHARKVQAERLAAAGYHGPIQAGEVVALKNLLKVLGKSDHVVYAWRMVEHHDVYQRLSYRMKGPNYLFKSPIPGLEFKDFIMLARMYRDGKGLKPAVQELMKRVPEELRSEAETFRTVDVLAGLGEK